MNNTNNIFKNKIIWRVYIAWFFKRILPLLILEVLFLAVAAYFFAQYVFIERVVDNTLIGAARNPFQMFSYLFWAFLQAGLLKQIAAVALLALGALLLRDFGRTVASYYSTRAFTRK